MVAQAIRGPGVSVVELRAAVALARLTGDGDGVTWGVATWERIWGRLSPPQQTVVYLVILVGLTQDQVAEQLGVSRGSISGTWCRALDRMRDAVPADI